MGRGKRSSQSMNTKMTNGRASSREGSSPKVEDDKISKLQNLNQILVKEIKSLREEKTILSENLTQMSSQFEAENKMKDELKKVEKELREELAKKETEHEATISKARTQLQEAQHKIQAISAETEATRKALELEKDELLSQIVDARKETEVITEELLRKDDHTSKLQNLNQILENEIKSLKEQLTKKETEHEAAVCKADTKLQEAQHKIEKVEKELREELAKKETEHEATISKADTKLQEAQHKIQAISAELEATRTA